MQIKKSTKEGFWISECCLQSPWLEFIGYAGNSRRVIEEMEFVLLIPVSSNLAYWSVRWYYKVSDARHKRKQLSSFLHFQVNTKRIKPSVLQEFSFFYVSLRFCVLICQKKNGVDSGYGRNWDSIPAFTSWNWGKLNNIYQFRRQQDLNLRASSLRDSRLSCLWS